MSRVAHYTERADTGWRCGCGKTSANTKGTIEQHQARAAEAAYKRLTDIEAGAVIKVTADNGTSLMNLLWTWLNNGALRPYARPSYDWLGMLRADIDWPALLTALDAGKLPGDDVRNPHMLRIAAWVAGHGTVNLDDVAGGLGDRDRLAVVKAIASRLFVEVEEVKGDE